MTSGICYVPSRCIEAPGDGTAIPGSLFPPSETFCISTISVGHSRRFPSETCTSMTLALREIPENPLPEGILSGSFAARDGCTIRHARVSTSGPNGTAILLQGRNESIEKYFETMADLAACGFDTATLDWRGQGGSDRLLRNPVIGHVRNFGDYVSDLDQFFREVVLPDCKPPYSILAHSMGGLIALLAIPRIANRVRRMVLAAPLIKFNETMPQKRISLLANLWTMTGLGSRHLPGTRERGKIRDFAGNQVTSDTTRFHRNLELARTYPELTVAGPSAAWVRAACRAMHHVSEPQFMAANRLPTLFLIAGSDKVVSSGAIVRYARTLRSGHCLTIDGARHELLQEADIFREQALAAFCTFAANRSEEPIMTEAGLSL